MRFGTVSTIWGGSPSFSDNTAYPPTPASPSMKRWCTGSLASENSPMGTSCRSISASGQRGSAEIPRAPSSWGRGTPRRRRRCRCVFFFDFILILGLL